MLSEYYTTGVFPDAPSDSFPAPLPLPPSVRLHGSLSQDKLILDAFLGPKQSSLSDCSTNCVPQEDCANNVSTQQQNCVSPSQAAGNCVTDEQVPSTEKLDDSSLLNSKHSNVSRSSCYDSILANSKEGCDTVNNNSPKHSSQDNTSLSSTHRVRPESEPLRVPLYPETHRPCLGKLKPVCLKHDPLEFIFRHIFYIVSSYVALTGLWHAACGLIGSTCC